jgi:hypothetical protein
MLMQQRRRQLEWWDEVPYGVFICKTVYNWFAKGLQPIELRMKLM